MNDDRVSLLVVGIVFSVMELLMVAYTLHMVRVRKDICRKPSIILFLLSLNATNVMVCIFSFLFVAGRDLEARYIAFFPAMFRNTTILLVIQRLIYMLERGHVCHWLVWHFFIGVNILYNVIFFVLWILFVIKGSSMAEMIINYNGFSSDVIAGLYMIAGTVYWVVFRRMLALAFRVALGLLFLTEVFRICNDQFISRKYFNQRNLLTAIGLVLNVLFFLILLFFLNVIIHDPETRYNRGRKRIIKPILPAPPPTMLTTH